MGSLKSEGKCVYCEKEFSGKGIGKHLTNYSKMEVINSPRMEVCAYDGGIIDTERDGIWKGKA